MVGQKKAKRMMELPLLSLPLVELKEVTVLLYSDVARAYRKCYLCGEASILREQ